jgi:hypothetical protein
VCDVDIDNWDKCKPDGTYLPYMCMFFKINKASGLSNKIKEK